MANTAKDKKSFCLFIDQMQRVRKLPEADRLKVFDAIIDYEAARHTEAVFEMPFLETTLAGYAFSEIAASLDRNAAEYDRISEEGAKSGRRGGLKSGEVRRAKQNEANEANALITKQNEAAERYARDCGLARPRVKGGAWKIPKNAFIRWLEGGKE